MYLLHIKKLSQKKEKKIGQSKNFHLRNRV